MGDTGNAVHLRDIIVELFYVKSGKNSMLWYYGHFQNVDELCCVRD